MLAVDVDDRRGRKLFGCDVFQATQVYSIHSINVRGIADSKRAHAAVFTKVVLVALGVELVFG